MGRPSKYPEKFRKDAIELVKSSAGRSRMLPVRGSARARCGLGQAGP